MKSFRESAIVTNKLDIRLISINNKTNHLIKHLILISKHKMSISLVFAIYISNELCRCLAF